MWSARRTLWGLDPHGADDAEAGCPLRFPGQYFDAETGLHYNLFRYYDPGTARYLSPDPLGLAAGPDPYGYPGNPLLLSDLLGLSLCVAKQLASRAGDIHGALPTQIARDKSTVAVIRVRTPHGEIDLVAGSGDGLTKAQKALLDQNKIPPEFAIPNIPGTHAEQNIMLHIIANEDKGRRPIAGGASRPICPDPCTRLLRASGGRITGDVVPNGRGTKIRTVV